MLTHDPNQKKFGSSTQMVRFLLDNPHALRSIQLQESSTARSRNDTWNFTLDSGETIEDKYAIRATIILLLRDMERKFGELGYKVWLSRKKYNIIKPEYAIEDVAKYLDLSLDKYMVIYHKVDEWLQEEGEKRNLITPYDT